MPVQPPHAIPPHGPVVFTAPVDGWSRESYRQAVQAFIRARGRAPQTITMHPDTFAAAMRATALHGAERTVHKLADAVRAGEAAVDWVAEQVVEPALDRAERGLQITTSHDHDRATIVME